MVVLQMVYKGCGISRIFIKIVWKIVDFGKIMLLDMKRNLYFVTISQLENGLNLKI